MVKMKFSDLIGTSTILKAEELAVITGGTVCGDGCSTGVCINNVKYGADTYCCNAVCTNGVGACSEKTSVLVDPITPSNPFVNAADRNVVADQFNPVNYVAVR